MIPDRYRVRSCEIPTTVNVCGFGRFYELVARAKPDYRHSLGCMSPSSRILDPGYLHSHVYFVPERAFRPTDPCRLPTTDVFSPFVSAMMKSSVLLRRKSEMKLSNFFANFARPDARKGEKELKSKLVRRCPRSRCVFLPSPPPPPPRDAISRTPLMNSTFAFVARDCFKRKHGTCRVRSIMPALQCRLIRNQFVNLVFPHTRRI